MNIRILFSMCLAIAYSANAEFLQGFTDERVLQSSQKYYGDNVTIAFSLTLGCGACIRGGYIFCYKGVEGSIMTTTLSTSNYKCCKTATDCARYYTDSTYTCSNTYEDSTLAKFSCPFMKQECGDTDTLVINNIGDTQNITMKINTGSSCFY